MPAFGRSGEVALGRVEQVARLLVGEQQGFHAVAKLGVARAGFLEVSSALSRLEQFPAHRRKSIPHASTSLAPELHRSPQVPGDIQGLDTSRFAGIPPRTRPFRQYTARRAPEVSSHLVMIC